MDYLLIIFGILFVLGGIAGSVLPVLPGPPLSYAGILLLHFTDRYHFSGRFLLIWAIATITVSVLDYYMPVWGTKKFGGSKRGIWGSMIGLVAGLFLFPPFGILIGPFLGAVIGELSNGKKSRAALRSGFGSFVGFILATLLKLIVSGMLAWHFFVKLF